MATVPRLTTARVTPGQLPAAFERADVPQVGGAIEGASRQISVAMQRYQDERDTQRVLETYTAASDSLRPVLYHRETGLYAQQGGKALGATEKATAELERISNEATEGMSPAQQRAFGAMWARTRAATLDGVSRHEARQFEAYQESNTKEMIRTAVDDASSAYTSEGAFDASYDLASAAIVSTYGGRESAEVVRGRLRVLRSAMRRAVLDRIITESPGQALAYYENHQEDIVGTDADDVVDQVKDADVLGRGAALAAEMYHPDEKLSSIIAAIEAEPVEQKIKDEATARVTRRRSIQLGEAAEELPAAAARLAARVSEAGEPITAREAAIDASNHSQRVKNEAKRLVREQRQVDDQRRKQAEDEAAQSAWVKVEAEGTTDNLTAEERRVLAERKEMGAAQQRALAIRTGVDTVHQPEAWAEFRQLSPQAIVALGPGLYPKYVNRMDRAHMQSAIEIQAGYRDSLTGKELSKQHAATLSFGERTLAAARKVGLVPEKTTRAKWDETAALRFDAWETEAARRVEAYESLDLEGKRKATGEEIQQILDDMALERVRIIRRFRSDPVVPATTVLPGEKASPAFIQLDQIPPDSLEDIKKILAAERIPATTVNIERLYLPIVREDVPAFREAIRQMRNERTGPLPVDFPP